MFNFVSKMSFVSGGYRGQNAPPLRGTPVVYRIFKMGQIRTMRKLRQSRKLMPLKDAAASDRGAQKKPPADLSWPQKSADGPTRYARYHCTRGITLMHPEPSSARPLASSHLRDSNPGPQLYELGGFRDVRTGSACDLAGCPDLTFEPAKSQPIQSPSPLDAPVLSYSLCGVPHISRAPHRGRSDRDHADPAFRAPRRHSSALQSDRQKAGDRLPISPDVRRAGQRPRHGGHDSRPDHRRNGRLAEPLREIGRAHV